MAITIANLNGVAIASVAKRNGIALSALAKINGLDNTAAASYLLTKDLVYADAAAAATDGWVDAGTPAWAYATSPAPLIGLTSSLNLDSSTDSSYHSFTGANPLYGYFVVNISSRASSFFLISIRSSSGTIQGRISIRSSGAVRAHHGTVTAEATPALGTFNANTTYHVWWDYNKSTAGNGVMSIYISTNATKPASPDVTMTNGDATADCSQVIFGAHGLTINTIFNKVRFSASNIGSNPT